jgi:hypothetical protein
MPLMSALFTGVAAASVTSAFAAQQYERVPWNAAVWIAAYADTGDTFDMNVFSGSDVLVQNGRMPILATAVPIIFPDHYSIQDVAARGEKIGLYATNQTGAVADFRANAILKPF